MNVLQLNVFNNDGCLRSIVTICPVLPTFGINQSQFMSDNELKHWQSKSCAEKENAEIGCFTNHLVGQ